MIRRATAGDIPQIVAWGEKFHAASPFAAYPYAPERVAGTVEQLLEVGCVLVSETGMAAAISAECWFAGVKSAQELFWWSEGHDGIELRQALEDWAREQGCQTFAMICLENEKTPVLTRLYRRAGYVPMEHHFTKRL